MHQRKNSGFLYKFFFTFRAGNGDLALTPGDTHLLAAPGAVKVPVLPVLQSLEKHQKFPVFLVALVGVSGKTPQYSNQQTNIGQQNKKNFKNKKPAKNKRQNRECNAKKQQRQTQFIGAVSALHKVLKEFSHTIT